MQYIDIANKMLEHKDKLMEAEINMYAITAELGIYSLTDEQKELDDRLKAYFYAPYYSAYYYNNVLCGNLMYFLDDKPVCTSYRNEPGEEEFLWFSEKDANMVKQYLLSLLTLELYINTTDITAETKDTYKIFYTSDVVDWNYGLYNDKPFEVKKIIKEPSGKNIETNLIIIQDGVEFAVNIKDIQFKYYI